MHSTIENTEISATDASGSSSELVLGLLHWLRIARYRRKTIIQAVCVCALLGAVYYLIAPRYFQSTAKLLIIQRNQDQLATVGEHPNLDNTMATHRELVTSPLVIQNAIEHLLSEHKVDLQDSPPSRWIEDLASRLSATTIRKTNFIQVNYRSLSPEAAAAVVSAVVQSYLEFVENTHKGTASDVLANLTHELESVKRTLAAKQVELQTFRQQYGALTVRTADGIIDPTIQKALKLNESLTAVQQRRLALENQLEALSAAIRTGADLQPFLAGLEDTVGRQLMTSALGLSPEDLRLIKEQQQQLFEAQNELQSLAPFYGPAHPRVVDAAERVRNIEQFLATYHSKGGERLAFGSNELGPLIEAMLAQSVEHARREEQQLAESFGDARDRAVRESGGLADLESRERELTRLENQQDILLNKIANIDLHQFQSPIQASVVQEPLPQERPVSPQLRLVVAVSLLAGLVSGGLIVYVQDVLDDRFMSPEDLMAQLGVPVLAMVRRLDPIEGTGLDTIHACARPNAIESEAFRTLRTAITLSTEMANRILISSAEPSDGKTTVAANLAVSFAQAGKRTLIVDADLRKPGMTALFALKGRSGVADLLQSELPLGESAQQLVHSTNLPNLHVLAAGTRWPNPAELLSSQRFGELLSWAESRYDQVLVDCPPVLAVSDAQVVGRLVDGAILVVRPEKNHRRLVVRACECFKATGSRVLGIVANGLSPDSGTSYGYGYGYGSNYGEGPDQDQNGEESIDSDAASASGALNSIENSDALHDDRVDMGGGASRAA